jgi:hypothetical protein
VDAHQLATLIAVPLLTGTVIPQLTVLVTKATVAKGIRNLITLALAALSGALATVTWGSTERWQDYVIAIGTAALASLITHEAGMTGPLDRATARRGLG